MSAVSELGPLEARIVDFARGMQFWRPISLHRPASLDA
jgi:hypothetical protein